MTTGPHHHTWQYRQLLAALAVVVFGLALSACSGQVTQHGHVFTAEELQQVQPGMSKDQVRLVLGTPDTTSAIGGGAFYYISSTQKGLAFMKPSVVDRKVLAVYFNELETVSRVANYGLKDGKIFDFISRTTPSHGADIGILQQMFGNLGKNVGNLFGN